MTETEAINARLLSDGFAITGLIYTEAEVSAIHKAIEEADHTSSAFRKTGDLFAIRRFLKEVPTVGKLIKNESLKKLIKDAFGPGYLIVKSIYFDKPAGSNWFVAYHQDLTISVLEKHETAGYGPWTKKQEIFSVQPPLPVLEHMITLRIHLDHTNEANGALKVIPGSHRKGIYRPETINWSEEEAVHCNVPQGCIMMMKPLLLHASDRTTNNKRRRVIHLELSNGKLNGALQWAEREALF